MRCGLIVEGREGDARGMRGERDKLTWGGTDSYGAPIWLGAFRERVCWWEVILLVISAFAGGKSFCWSDGPLLAKQPFAGGKSFYCAGHNSSKLEFN